VVLSPRIGKTRLAVHAGGRAYLYFVHLLVSDERTHFSDNYFDLASATRSGQQLGAGGTLGSSGGRLRGAAEEQSFDSTPSIEFRNPHPVSASGPDTPSPYPVLARESHDRFRTQPEMRHIRTSTEMRRSCALR
jgi:hypothetical protein